MHLAHDLPLLVTAIGPVVALFLLSSNAAIVFLSLCLGEVLVRYVAADGISLLTSLWPHAGAFSQSMLQLVFLYAPAVATAVLMIGSVKGHMRRLLNLLPATGVGLLATLMGVPLFTPGLRQAIQQGSFWHVLNRAQALVVGLTTLICLLFLWGQRRGLRTEPARRKSRN